VREFDTGATRDIDDGKLDYEGFLSYPVVRRYAEYMHENRIQADGNLRDSDNWQKGIPQTAYMKSMFRHFMEVWNNHRNPACSDEARAEHEDSLCALMFNVHGMLHELLKGEVDGKFHSIEVAGNQQGDGIFYEKTWRKSCLNSEGVVARVGDGKIP